jgi:thiamine biosynthesis protein ThiI
MTSFTFKVETKRADKTYPMTSLEISKKVAGLVLPNVEGMKVDVHNPDVTLSIDFRFEAAYIYTNAISGLGGYPSGIQGNGLVMMSGGLDSPVSAFMCINKGVNVSAIHFFSPPYTSYSSLQKVIDLLEDIAYVGGAVISEEYSSCSEESCAHCTHHCGEYIDEEENDQEDDEDEK